MRARQVEQRGTEAAEARKAAAAAAAEADGLLWAPLPLACILLPVCGVDARQWALHVIR